MKKSKKQVIGTLLLAVVMVFSMATSAFADEAKTTVVGTGSAQITSKFVFAEGLKVPGGDNGVTFNYTITAKNGGPTASIDSVNFKDTDKTANNLNGGLYTLSKTPVINFGTFSHAGVYNYEVFQTVKTVQNVTPCQSQYNLRVWVENDGTNGGLKISSITAVKANTSGADTGSKLSEITFTNTYRNMGNLTITKNTVSSTGPDVADKTKAFDFNINFTKSPTTDTMTTITGTIQDKNKKYLGRDGEIVDEAHKSLTFKVGDSTTFKLKDGDILTFDQVPVGTTYKAVEPYANDGYTRGVSVFENGEQTVNIGKFEANQDAVAVASGKTYALVGENTNEVVFTNTYDEQPITGIIMNNLPFILLIAIGVLALSVLVISRKRRTADR